MIKNIIVENLITINLKNDNHAINPIFNFKS